MPSQTTSSLPMNHYMVSSLLVLVSRTLPKYRVAGYKASLGSCLADGPRTHNETRVQDFGVWNITYESVACSPSWNGSSNSAALGAATGFGPRLVMVVFGVITSDAVCSVCCPNDPWVNTISFMLALVFTISADLT